MPRQNNRTLRLFHDFFSHWNGIDVSCILAFVKTMGKRCMAFGCSYVPSKGISLFQFPTDFVLQAEWTKQAQRTRDGPTNHSILCSEHITKD